MYYLYFLYLSLSSYAIVAATRDAAEIPLNCCMMTKFLKLTLNLKLYYLNIVCLFEVNSRVAFHLA